MISVYSEEYGNNISRAVNSQSEKQSLLASAAGHNMTYVSLDLQNERELSFFSLIELIFSLHFTTCNQV